MPEICCRLDAFDGPEERARHQALLRRVREVAVSMLEIDDGLRLVLPGEPAAFLDAAAWIALERRCCPFLRFTLAWDEAGPTLSIVGPPGAAAIVRDALVASSGRPEARPS